MKNTNFQSIVDFSMLILLLVACVILSPILIPLFIIDDVKEDNYYKRYLQLTLHAALLRRAFFIQSTRALLTHMIKYDIIKRSSPIRLRTLGGKNMKKTNFVCTEPMGTPKMTTEVLSKQINTLLSNYEFHDQVIAPVQIITSTTPAGQQFFAYTTIWLPSADENDTAAISHPTK